MRKKPYFYLFALCTVGILCSCQQDYDYDDRPDAVAAHPGLTLGEARAYFETLGAATRSTSGVEEFNYFDPGVFTPLWPEGTLSSSDSLSSADVPVAGERLYHVVYGADTLRAYRLWHEVVVVKRTTDQGGLGSYLLFYIPDSTCVDAFPAERFARFRNCEGKPDDFTGRAVYTTQTGFPVAAVRYECGWATADAFLGDASRTLEQNFEGLYAIIGGLRLAVSEAATRAIPPLPPPAWTINSNEPVVVIGQRPPLKPTYDYTQGLFDNTGIQIEPYVIHLKPGSGGGNPGNITPPEPGEDGKYMENDLIEVEDAELEELLDLLMKDCMGAKLITSLEEKITIKSGDKSRHGVGFDSQTGTYYHQITIRPDQQLPIVMMEELIHAFQTKGKQDGSRKLNNEIEAKIGWTGYLIRNNKPLNDKALGGREGARVFSELYTSFENLGTSVISDAGYYNFYMTAADILKGGGQRRTAYTDYSLDWDYCGVESLIKLMEDCLDELKNR